MFRPTTVVGGRRRSLALGASGVLVLALAACGGSDSADEDSSTTPEDATTQEADTETEEDPTEVISAAVDAGLEAGSASFTLDSTTSVAGQDVAISGEGQLDTANETLQMTLTTQVPGAGEIVLEQVVADGAVYINGFPGAEDQWVVFTPEELAETGLDAGGTDPSQQLELLRGVGDDLTESGEEQVNGVDTTRYTGTIDLAAVAEQSGGGADAGAQFEELGVTELPFELYIDADGLPARMVVNLEADVEGQTLSSVSTIDYTDWGTEVAVEVPADAISFTDLAAQLGEEPPA